MDVSDYSADPALLKKYSMVEFLGYDYHQIISILLGFARVAGVYDFVNHFICISIYYQRASSGLSL